MNQRYFNSLSYEEFMGALCLFLTLPTVFRQNLAFMGISNFLLLFRFYVCMLFVYLFQDIYDLSLT